MSDRPETPDPSVPPAGDAGDAGERAAAEAIAAAGVSVEPVDVEVLAAGESDAARQLGSNDYFRAMVDRNFLEYASYAIRDRAIPNVDDGLKPVQRRILWAMHRVDDGRTNKASFIVGEVMGKYHPHGDASIKDALVVLANKEYFIEKQGNFGNIFTGSSAAAPRYIECGLTPLAREVLYNDDITEMVETYDGRNREPVALPVRIPALLMLGSDGIAVGMATRILPHNFNELLRAQIAALNGEPFTLYPDFLQGGLMDVRDYADGNGRITLRARIEIVDRKLIIREIPATTTTESLIASIEKAAERGKIKITSVNDYTAQNVEIEVVPTRGYDPEKAMQALYMYTDCSVSISPNLTVIRDFRPAVMTVTEVIERNTARLLEYLRRELEIALERQNELFHAKTLAQIFFENRIYKRIEECKTEGEEYTLVAGGLAPFRGLLRRDVTREDIDRLLALPVRRIARFDIEKNQRELVEIESKIAELTDKLRNLKRCAIRYLENLLEKYGPLFPRRTEIEFLDKIDRRSAALNNIKIGWDRRSGYIGTGIRSDDTITCNEFDLLLLLEKSGAYKVAALPPEKFFVGKLYDCRRYDAEQEFGILYRDVKSGKLYGKRSRIGSFIRDREYRLCPENCRLELFTPRADAVYELTRGGRGGSEELTLLTLPLRSAKARGILVSARPVVKITHRRYLDPEAVEALRGGAADDPDDDGDSGEEAAVSEAAEAAETTESIESSAAPRRRRVAPIIAEVLAAAAEAYPPEPKRHKAAVSETTAEKAIPKKVTEPPEIPEKQLDAEIVAPDHASAVPLLPVQNDEQVTVAPPPVEPVKPVKPVKPIAPVEPPPPVAPPKPVAPVEPTPADWPPWEDPPPGAVPVPMPEEAPVLPEPPPVHRRPGRPPKPAAPNPSAPPKSGPDDDGPDELGIVQPEFGF